MHSPRIHGPVQQRLEVELRVERRGRRIKGQRGNCFINFLRRRHCVPCRSLRSTHQIFSSARFQTRTYEASRATTSFGVNPTSAMRARMISGVSVQVVQLGLVSAGMRGERTEGFRDSIIRSSSLSVRAPEVEIKRRCTRTVGQPYSTCKLDTRQHAWLCHSRKRTWMARTGYTHKSP